MKDMVTITCYGQTEKMERKDAMSKYLEGMMLSEGSEQERYMNIYLDLEAGLSDIVDIDY